MRKMVVASTPSGVVPVVGSMPELTIRQAGEIADNILGQSAFTRYRERMAEDTVRRHRADIALFSEYLLALPGVFVIGDLYNDPSAWSDMSFGLVEGFVKWMLNRGYSVGSINMRLATVKLYCRLAQGAGALDASRAAMIRTIFGYRGREGKRIDTSRDVVRVGAKKAETTWLTVEQAKMLVNQPDTPQGRRDCVLMCILLYHGLRCEEVQQLQVSSFDMSRGEFAFYQQKVDGNLRHILNDVVYKAVARYFEMDKPVSQLLLGSRKGGRLGGTMSKSAINQRVGILGRQIGVERLSPHDCRHFWANSAVEAGTSLEHLKQAGGWASLEMPSYYVKRLEVANSHLKLFH